ncbi:Inosine/xanthosine triphosphate pyrophosphatase all-alpha NTP-PPase family [Methanonatronarchaeum thermophilum]|uniref:dITP/XTP pyrophosphatase n=1 Tax=Methanonatronarchaeum thermophilum TaxID=1927129 RepID=A0A1Y3GEM2_9EURY|nr:XTP/dITP diphosphatase [Methanonatronarchaeum thermophilum]OUJ18634.1 Inosine/xanthosine triphosphate pyrophosphatase all-alpha NTP-PPase family [Methanonatronarchaeum thermophilum]
MNHLKEITFVTSNQHKIMEAKDILSPIKIEGRDIGYPEIQDTIENVAIEGAKYAYKKIKKPLIVEDSGLYINTYNGFPGPYSAYTHETIGNKGILKLMKNKTNRKCYFKSIVVYIDQHTTKKHTGKIKGQISKKQKGPHGFGYDPIFIPNNHKKTFGEIEMKEKNKLSHRRQALKKLKKWLKTKTQ